MKGHRGTAGLYCCGVEGVLLEGIGAHWTVKQVSGGESGSVWMEVTLGEEVENSLESEVFVKDEGQCQGCSDCRVRTGQWKEG